MPTLRWNITITNQNMEKPKNFNAAVLQLLVFEPLKDIVRYIFDWFELFMECENFKM